MLSRVAEEIYWMGRYRERAENVARLLEVNLHLSADAPAEMGNQWIPMVQTMGDEESFEKKYGEEYDEANVINFLAFDRDNPSSMYSSLSGSRANARMVREIITSEMWQEINTVYLHVKKMASDRSASHTYYEFFSRIKRQCQLFTGITETTMLRNEAWQFARMGNLLERADMISRTLDVKYFMLLPSPDHVGTPYDNIQWMALLKSASAFEMYRKKWRQVNPVHVVGFLMLDPEFPRSIYSCIIRALDALRIISKDEPGNPEDHPLKKMTALKRQLETVTSSDVIRLGLHEFIDTIQTEIAEIHEAVTEKYFVLWTADE